MLRNIVVAAILLIDTAFSLQARAVWIYIPDASQVYYQTRGNGRIYFRNFDSFDANAMGCCYNYWIDPSTTEGKSIYALFLSYIAQGKGFRIAIPDGKQPGPVGAAGTW
jgi:hypothetical protein